MNKKNFTVDELVKQLNTFDGEDIWTDLILDVNLSDNKIYLESCEENFISLEKGYIYYSKGEWGFRNKID